MIKNLSEIVKEIGGLLLQWRAAGIRQGVWEGTQFKARADAMAHAALSNRLQTLAADLPILSEEDVSSQVVHRPDRYWLIDPIDGTASFVQGFDGFVTQVALIQDGQPCLAAINAPALALTYIAERGKGSYVNGERLALAGSGAMDVLIDNYPDPRGITRAAYTGLGFSRYLECGGISLKICRVADGTADIFFKNVMVKDWDLAAPQLVLSEAGGVLQDIHGGDISYDRDYSHEGLIAAASEEACRRLADWYRAHEKEPCPS
jgi:3'(2'), 5'-bisphosphate nucleotidase